MSPDYIGDLGSSISKGIWVEGQRN